MVAFASCAGGSADGETAPISVATTPEPVTTVRSMTIPPSSSTVALTTSTSGVPLVDCATGWTVRAKVAQLVMPGVRGQDLTAATATLVSLGVGGVIVMTWPTDATTAALVTLKNSTPVPMLLAVDEEGGDVQRLRPLGVLPSATDVAATMTPAEAEGLVAAHAALVAALGFDVVFAPVVDVGPPDGVGIIGDRSFGTSPSVVTAFGAAYVKAWMSAGVLPVLKHFPGHGRATADSHDGSAVTPPLTSLRSVDLVPYRELAASGAGVMVGHLDVPGLTEPGVPASLSPAAIGELLRGELGYGDALVFTDSLSMGAITSRFTVAHAVVLAIAAGADIALIASLEDVAAVIDALASAVADGRITAERLASALGHVLAAKHLTC